MSNTGFAFMAGLFVGLALAAIGNHFGIMTKF